MIRVQNAEIRQALLGVFEAALERVSGQACVRRFLAGRAVVPPCGLVAIGKAAQSMARGACEALGPSVQSGLVITKTGHMDPVVLGRLGLRGIEAEHPLPGKASLAAGGALLEYLAGLPDALPVLFLISGGTSSLVEVPAPGVSPEALQRVNRWLLGSGLAIDQVNLVRKAISGIKGGRLLQALNGRPVEALLISDVPGDAPSIIGSGLLVPEPDLAGRLAALELPDWIRSLVSRRPAPDISHLPEPNLSIVAKLEDALVAAEVDARRRGYRVIRHAEFISGDAAAAGRRLARQVVDAAPALHLWGGETTVKLPEVPGAGGRNQHLALAAAQVIAGRDDIGFLSGGTDGTDGPTDDAGGLVDGGTLERVRLAGLDPDQALARADSGTLLAASGDLVQTGPTGTNVMDLMIGLKGVQGDGETAGSPDA